MKKIWIYAMILLLAGCSDMDNYDAPDSTLEGGIYDLATRGSAQEELIPAQAPNGARIRLYEEGSTQPVNFWCKTDGSFFNNRIFATDYSIIPEGPFITLPNDTIYTSVPAKEKIKFYVEPFLRIKHSANLSGDKMDVTFTITKSDKWSGKVNQYAILYSWTEHLDISNYSARELVTVNTNEEDKVLNKELSFRMKNIDTSRPVFIRIAARTDGSTYYNYSGISKH